MVAHAHLHITEENAISVAVVVADLVQSQFRRIESTFLVAFVAYLVRFLNMKTERANVYNLFSVGPSFIQSLEDTNEVGPALLIQNVVQPIPATATTAKQDVSDSIDSSKISKNNLSYREYKSFNFLLPGII